MDYALFPPEINSARIYSGPGSGSLMAAAGSWDSLSAELGTTAETYESVLSSLTTLHWRGPASDSMTAAAASYVQWLTTTAQQTKQTAMQARAAATAFDQAFAMTVPPPLDSIQLVNTAIQGTGTMAGIPASLSGNTANLFGIQANMAYLAGLSGPSPALGPIGLGELRGAASATGLSGMPNAITVSMGRANTIGPMAVPAGWSAPSATRVAALEPAGLTTLPGTDELAGSGYPGVPGMPAGTMARASGVLPRYGTRLTVMTRPPAGG